MRSFLLCLFLCVSFVGVADAFSRKIVTDGLVEVRGEVGKVVDITFEDGIAKLIKSGVADSITVETVEDHLFITPKSNTPADLMVIDTKGQSFKLRFAFDKGYDERLMVSSNNKTTGDDGQRGERSIIEVLRYVMTGRTPPGAEEQALDQIIFDNKQIRMRLIYQYEMSHVLVYVVAVENLLNQSLIVPIQEISYPNLAAVAADKDMLEKKGTEGSITKVFMAVTR